MCATSESDIGLVQFLNRIDAVVEKAGACGQDVLVHTAPERIVGDVALLPFAENHPALRIHTVDAQLCLSVCP